MNTTTIEHHQAGAASGRPQWRIRHLACVAVALMVTSAGAGALAQHVSAVIGKKPAVIVVHEHGGVDDGGDDHFGPTSQCPSTASGPRIVLVTLRSPSIQCTKPPVLVSARVSAGASF